MPWDHVPSLPGAYVLYCRQQAIYVGSTDNLRRRLYEHATDPENACVRRCGWDSYDYRATATLSQARRLELAAYEQLRPVCNLVRPPGA